MHHQTPEAPGFGILKQLQPRRNPSKLQLPALFTQPGPITDLPRTELMLNSGSDDHSRCEPRATIGRRNALTRTPVQPLPWQSAHYRLSICGAHRETSMASEFNVQHAAGYEQLMGRWSQKLAPLFIEFAGIDDD